MLPRLFFWGVEYSLNLLGKPKSLGLHVRIGGIHEPEHALQRTQIPGRQVDV